MGVTELIKDGNNVQVKNTAGAFSAVFPSLGTHAYSDDCHDYIVYLSSNPSDRDIKARLLAINVNLITTPAPPVGGWTQVLFLQELNDNFLNCPLDVNAVVNIPSGLATEATLLNVLSESEFDNKLLQVECIDPIAYLGYAEAGALKSDPVWAIKKLDETTGFVFTWADGDKEFNNVWDDRATLIYS